MTVPDSGRKRAGEWLNSDLDLDDFKKQKRYKAQEISCDLSGMHLEPGGGAEGPPCPAASASSLQTTSMATSAADGCGGCGGGGGGGSPQAMQCTPRSESRTPSVHQAGGGCGGQPSVHSGGRARLPSAPRPTPMRLLDVLNLHPTSPSDPGLDGQLDLRKATLMRSLQTRLMRGDADVSPPAPMAVTAEDLMPQDHQAQQQAQQAEHQPNAQQQQQQQQQPQQQETEQQHAQPQQSPVAVHHLAQLGQQHGDSKPLNQEEQQQQQQQQQQQPLPAVGLDALQHQLLEAAAGAAGEANVGCLSPQGHSSMSCG